MPGFVGILVFTGLLTPGVVLIVLGALGLRRCRANMSRVLSLVALVVGISVVVILAAAVLVEWTPWKALLWVVAGGVGLGGFVFWAMVLADCLMNETREGNERLVWTLAIIFTLVLGAGLYYFLRRPKRIAEASGG